MTPTNVQSPIEVKVRREERFEKEYPIGGVGPRSMTMVHITTNQFARMLVHGEESDALAYARKQLQAALGEIEARMTKEELAGEVALELASEKDRGIHCPIRYYTDMIRAADDTSRSSMCGQNPYVAKVLALVRKLLADKLHVPPERLNDVR